MRPASASRSSSLTSEALDVSAFTRADEPAWDAFVARAKNATFLLQRAYMDYHADRFEDHSLIVRGGDGAVVALLPADRRGVVVRSHAGLTYGGFLIGEEMTLPRMLRVFDAAVGALRVRGVDRLVYKTIPSIYHAAPAEEDRYCLFRAGARLVRRDVLTVVDYRHPCTPQERRARSVRKAARGGVTARPSADFAAFWSVLDENLTARYGVRPVHSLEEITTLAARFPENIQLYAAYERDALVAGAVVYLSATVCHVQYNAASARGRAVGALDAVLDHLLRAFEGTKRFFDFGASTEADGRVLNQGLVEYKEGFGARTAVHDIYELDLATAATPPVHP